MIAYNGINSNNQLNMFNRAANKRSAGTVANFKSSHQVANGYANLSKKMDNGYRKPLREVNSISDRGTNVTRMSESQSIISNAQSYSESLRASRLKSKDTSLKLKKLKYHFKDISTKILKSKTSVNAKQVESQARREVLRLKREKQNPDVDTEELDAAIAHAKAMERVAKKKYKHLLEEEMAKISGGPCAGGEIEENEDDKAINEYPDEGDKDIADNAYEDIEYDETEYEDAAFDEKMYEDEIYYEDEMMDDLTSDLLSSEMTDMLEELSDELSESMKEMLEDMGLDDLTEEMTFSKDMDPADLKAMKIKHRNKEMKDIVKADADYLKRVFKHLNPTSGMSSPANSPNQTPIASGGAMTESINLTASINNIENTNASIDICL